MAPDPGLPDRCRTCGADLPAVHVGDRCVRCMREHGLGILAEHRSVLLEDVEPEDVEPRAQKHVLAVLDAPQKSRGLLVTGSPGVGKTRLLAAIVREARMRNRHVVYGMAAELMRMTWNVETKDRVIRDLAAADVLLVDDLIQEGSATVNVTRRPSTRSSRSATATPADGYHVSLHIDIAGGPRGSRAGVLIEELRRLREIVETNDSPA